MAIAFDSSASGKLVSSSDPVTVSHTLGSGSDRYVVVVIADEDGGQVIPDAPTYNGTAMSLAVASAWNQEVRLLVYTLGEASLPVAGTYDVVSSPPAATVLDQHTVFVYSYSGVEDQAPEATSSNTATGTSINTNITTVTDGARIVGGVISHNFQIPSATSGQTNVIGEQGGNAGSAAGDEAIATAGSEAFSWSVASTYRLAVAVLSLAPAAGAAAPNAPTGVTASNPTASTIDLAWTDTNSASAFPRLYRRTPAGSGEWTFVEQLADASATTYTFTGLAGATEYDLGVSYASS